MCVFSASLHGPVREDQRTESERVLLERPSPVPASAQPLAWRQTSQVSPMG